ncbi:glycosyltransferase family 4 protein [Candidatus Micrarchaeota archaeon]|nr:glycosyltransferase family 4 protein [Candidatus Micrarchaeota archaeon]
MKIAIGVPDNLENQEWNGFRTAFRNINDALSGHEKIVFAPNGGNVRLEEGNNDPADLMNRYHNTIALAKDFGRKVSHADHDAVLAFNSMGLFLSEKFIYYTSNVPYKKVVELVDGEYPETAHFRKLLDYYGFVAEREIENYEKAEKIIVHSMKIQEHIVEQGIAPGKIVYIARPIPKMQPGGERKVGKMRIIIMPAELRVMKGVKYAIETMKLLKDMMPNAILIITGRINNYEQDYMKQLLHEAGGKANVIATGFLPKEQLHRYMQAAECAFMPFCFDECPIALSECIGYGLPVVTNEYAGFDRETIGRFGYCARHKDINDYAEGLGRILSDDDLRMEKRRGTREITEKFNFDRYKKEINNVFEEFGKG